MQISKARSGSTAVEAAVVIPIVFIVIAMLFSSAFGMMQKEKDNASLHSARAEEWLADTNAGAEKFMRQRFVFDDCF